MSTFGSGTFGSGTFGDPGGAAGVVEMSATVDGSGSVEGSLAAPVRFEVTADGTASVVATLGTVPAAGTRGRANQLSSPTGALQATWGHEPTQRSLGPVRHLKSTGYFETPVSTGPTLVNLNAEVLGSAEVQASISASLALAVTADGSGTTEATVVNQRTIAVTADGVATVVATVTLLRTLELTADGSGTVQATLASLVALEVDVGGTGSVQATLGSRVSLTAEADGSGSVEADLTVVPPAVLVEIEATVDGVGSVDASLVALVLVSMEAVVLGTGTAQSLLGIAPVVLPPYVPSNITRPARSGGLVTAGGRKLGAGTHMRRSR